MSYIIAFVTYSNPDREFPVECFRPDLVLNDSVVVRRSDGKLTNAIVRRLQYLSWDCAGRIECKLSEAAVANDGNIVVPQGSPLIVGLATAEAFIKALRSRGWIPLKSKQIMYKVLANVNASHTAYIFIRRNGIDVQLLPLNGQKNLDRTVHASFRPREGRVVRHYLAHTTFNLYEGMLRFSDSFLKDEPDLERYFVSQGADDRRTDELKAQSEMRKRQRSEMADIYDACSDGSGGPAYLSDGIWITSGGRTHDWGR